MNKTKFAKRLALNSETLCKLNGMTLARVVGGAANTYDGQGPCIHAPPPPPPPPRTQETECSRYCPCNFLSIF